MRGSLASWTEARLIVLPWFDMTLMRRLNLIWTMHLVKIWAWIVWLFELIRPLRYAGIWARMSKQAKLLQLLLAFHVAWIPCLYFTNWLFGCVDDKSIRLQKYGMSDMGYLLAWLGSCLNPKSANLDRWSWIRLVNSGQPPPLCNFAHATMDELSTWLKLA